MKNPLLNTKELPKFNGMRAADIESAINETIRQNEEELSALLDAEDKSETAPDFASYVPAIEEMGDRLHKVWGPVSHLHGVLNSPELREAYNACLPLLSRYNSELSQNQRLFRVYKRIAEGMGSTSSPERALVEHALLEFNLGGINLPEAQQARLREIRESLTQLQARFEQNLLDAMLAWQHHTADVNTLSGLPESALSAAKQAAEAESKEGWLLALDQPSYVAVLTYAKDPELREKFYKAWCTRASDQPPSPEPFDNTKNMAQILTLRQEMAQLLGYKSYADYALATRMAGSVEEVTDFLKKLAGVSMPAAKRELKELEVFAGRELAPWDIAYYSEKLRLQRFSISDEELRPYFPLDRVLDGLFGLVRQLYGIELEQLPNADVWHPDVRYYSVKNRGGTIFGGVYVDLYARKNKRAGAWMDECRVRKQFNGNNQNPVAHLVCNFAPPLNNEPALLTHDDVVTLFHEFGHTLHHLLTVINYPSISGINGVPWDAVELPSQFMENFAWSPQVAKQLSGHYQTGEALPDDLLNKLEASRIFQAGMQMVRQLEFSLFDWYLHSEPDTDNAAGKAMHKARDEVAVIKAPEYNRMTHSFAHVYSGGYAAGYYSYKWAEVLAADAYSAFEEGGLFNPDLAQRFRQEILQIGGSKDIAKAFETFRGRPPSINALLKQSGIETKVA